MGSVVTDDISVEVAKIDACAAATPGYITVTVPTMCVLVVFEIEIGIEIRGRTIGRGCP